MPSCTADTMVAGTCCMYYETSLATEGIVVSCWQGACGKMWLDQVCVQITWA